MMGEIDTKPIESVQASLSLFGEKSEQRKNRSTSRDELEKVKELEDLLKHLANHKVQLEAKDSAYKQALLKVDHYQEIVDELTSLLKDSEFEKDKYINECREGKMRIGGLESKVKEMANHQSETVNIREQLSLVISELKATQAELFSMETELAAVRDAKLEALKQAELMETELQMEKEKTEELLRHVSELNEAILHSRLAAIDAEKEKSAILSEKEAVAELATKRALEAEEVLEYMRKELEAMRGLENQLMVKSITIDSLQVELQKANELHDSSEKAASDAISELNQLKSDLELQERKNTDQLGYIESLEMELNQFKLELENAKEELPRLNSDAERLRGELEKAKIELDEIRERETEAQVEIAMLKSELHKGRSRMAAAEAAEARAKSEKSALYIAVQQLALEAEEAKKEYRKLKEEAQIAESNACIMISKEEYEGLIEKAEKADQVPEPVPKNTYELENLMKELEIAAAKIREFRTRAEQATTRAEVAEKAKEALEDQIRKRREQREKRKAAIASLREEPSPRESSSFKYQEESSPREISSFNYGQAPKTYQPLSKVLNMKF